MTDDKKLRLEIIEKTIEYYQARFAPIEFIPGKTRVNYATLAANPTANVWALEEANFTYSDASRSPLFFKAGRGFVPFGNYANPFEFSPTMIQAASQLNEEFVQLGVASAAGWHASAAGWTGNSDDWKYTVDFGFKHSMRGVGFNFDASYITDLGEVASQFTNETMAAAGSKDSGWQAGVSTNLKGVDLGARYFKANVTSAINVWGVHAGYAMNSAGYNHGVGFDWETANTAATPRDSRWSAEYKVGLAKNVDAAFKYTKHTAATSMVEPKLWTVTLTGKF